MRLDMRDSRKQKVRTKTSLWIYYVFSVICLVLTLFFVSHFAGSTVRRFVVEYMRKDLVDKAHILVDGIEQTMLYRGPDALKECHHSSSHLRRIRVVLISSSGEVVCDSVKDSDDTASLWQRPEVREALEGVVSSKTLFENSHGLSLISVAAPLKVGDEVKYVIRLSMQLTAIEDELASTVNQMRIAGILCAITLVIISTYLYRQINPPLEEIRLGAERFARGQFDERLPDYRIKEIAALASAMNRMQAQLRHLEEVRSDFVANVSHELKTPITSIKGFVETLQDGAMDNRADLERFLSIISRQSERMTSIIDDLLTLSRLESARMPELLSIAEHRIRDMLLAIVDTCAPIAQEKDIKVVVDCPPEWTFDVDRSLMEQAVLNLVDNAVKYSGAGTEVIVKVEYGAESVLLNVRDSGPGISDQHLSRLFERFYRVDKARSRTIGGTGLGLAIVKHVVGVHKGSVSVESAVGEGTSFTIDLPRVSKA
jgi:signal transduction histidine kinase